MEVNNNGTVMDYIFGLNGRVQHYNTAASRGLGEDVFAGGEHIGLYANGTLYMLHHDQVGSVRKWTVYSGGNWSSQETVTNLPFGDALTINSGSGVSDHDYFSDFIQDPDGEYKSMTRKLSGTQGRWTTPDPAGLAAVDPADPQSWNLYAYVMNNPLTLTDPRGLYCAYLDDDGDQVESIDDSSDNGECAANGGFWIEGSYGGGSRVFVNVDTGLVEGIGYDSHGNPEISVAGAVGSWGAWTQTFTPVGSSGSVAASNARVPNGDALNPYAQAVFSHPKLQTAASTMTDPRTYVLWTGASAIEGVLLVSSAGAAVSSSMYNSWLSFEYTFPGATADIIQMLTPPSSIPSTAPGTIVVGGELIYDWYKGQH